MMGSKGAQSTRGSIGVSGGVITCTAAFCRPGIDVAAARETPKYPQIQPLCDSAQNRLLTFTAPFAGCLHGGPVDGLCNDKTVHTLYV